MKHLAPRFTKDLELWISTDQENATAVYAAPKEFGAPLKGLTRKISPKAGGFLAFPDKLSNP
jgi:hypothetical protein